MHLGLFTTLATMSQDDQWVLDHDPLVFPSTYSSTQRTSCPCPSLRTTTIRSVGKPPLAPFSPRAFFPPGLFPAPFLSAPREYVFPGINGKRRPEHTKMEQVFRRILTRAGIVVGYRHICRRCVARRDPQVLQAPDAEIRRCPKCNMRMWPSAIPRPMRFHDVRHTTITLFCA
jgi:hypothetical protein